MRADINRRIILKSRPVGIPRAEHFELSHAALPHLEIGQILIGNRYLSIDPAMRGWTNPTQNYSQPVAIGSVMRSFAVGEVVQSRRDEYAEGDVVVGMFVTEFCELKAGDVVVVSSASGSVGSAAGQIAKLHGCRTVGITGGNEKAKRCIEEFGYDAALDYKDHKFEDQIKDVCPHGVDVYFDNTSGFISDAVVRNLAFGARVVVCGTASIADWEAWPSGPRVERHLLVKRARMQGFVNLDYDHKYEAAVGRLAGWVRSGQLKYREDIREGLESAPALISELYEGAHHGKLLVKI